MILSRRNILAGGTAAIAWMTSRPVRASSGSGANAQASSQRNGSMEIVRSGSQPSQQGAPEYFTGQVRVDLRFQRPAPARIGGGIVTFEAGSRTAWHTHPLGQTLIVVSGCGWVRVDGATQRGGPARRYRLVCTRRKTLAWRHRDNRDELYRPRRGVRWQVGGLARNRFRMRITVDRGFRRPTRAWVPLGSFLSCASLSDTS